MIPGRVVSQPADCPAEAGHYRYYSFIVSDNIRYSFFVTRFSVVETSD